VEFFVDDQQEICLVNSDPNLVEAFSRGIGSRSSQSPRSIVLVAARDQATTENK
jgi:hypothetical protein